ncbi:glycerophosphodiester phosphodiesterase [Anatilimnocola sp. NA78]|uniref:glycerophosphodiester phosphodiesterase n=1 Tax=Anatilimnocola sp. NA78 TaxID=3415683 RepID=UPI003CE4F980
MQTLSTFGCLLLLSLPVNLVAADLNSAAKNVKQIIAHRGVSAERPENTLAAIRRAIEVGATATEVDVRTTKDGKLVLSHDAKVDRMTNGKGSIGELTLAELKQLDAGAKFAAEFKGEPLATLAEAADVCRGKIDLLLDLKETGDEYAERVAAVIRKSGDEARTIVGVRSVDQAKQFRKLLPKARQLGLMAKPDEIEAYAAAGVEMLRLWPKWLKDESLPARVRKTGCKLHLNGEQGTEEELHALLAHQPDSLSADHPAQLIQRLKQLAK